MRKFYPPNAEAAANPHHMKKKLWTCCNDLSGKEWIPPNPGYRNKNGWYEDVPRRVYVGTPWLFFTLAIDEPPWLSVNRRRKEPSPRTTHLYLVLKELGHTNNDVVAHHIDNRELGLALVESLSLERKRTEYLDYDVENEVQAMINQVKGNNPMKRALQHALDQFQGVSMRSPRRLLDS